MKSKARSRILFNRAKISKNFTYRGKGKLKGSGHTAGEEWGDAKDIDPNSRVTKYSKNSPSFSEGVQLSKAKRRALESLTFKS